MVRRGRGDGLTLVETLVAAFLLGVTVVVAGTVLVRAEAFQARTLRRALALDLAKATAESLHGMARVESGPFPFVLPPPDELPGAAQVLTVVDDLDLGLSQVDVEVSWQGRDPGSVRLHCAVGTVRIYR